MNGKKRGRERVSGPETVSSQWILPERASWADFNIPTLKIKVNDASTTSWSYSESLAAHRWYLNSEPVSEYNLKYLANPGECQLIIAMVWKDCSALSNSPHLQSSPVCQDVYFNIDEDICNLQKYHHWKWQEEWNSGYPSTLDLITLHYIQETKYHIIT